ncbi:helix-turn-helix domain-containing protein [Lentzea albida]|uniref:PucR C-terminal helix-turn-helix domain-containing protein n=1 Tax=Lentzea albida TaxID=65499 RepID=A0A1H9WUL0_9PSEU|nr:helix-turn-helix domain-containing protein [Lentzea albida]SES37073.1 PucR C-terminal helix-turn-helix domain-containing protein [Lentzea albida]
MREVPEIHTGHTPHPHDVVLQHVARCVSARLQQVTGPPRTEETAPLVDHFVGSALAGNAAGDTNAVLRAALYAVLHHLWDRAAPDDQPRLREVGAWCAALESVVTRNTRHALARATSSQVSWRTARSRLTTALVEGGQICPATARQAGIAVAGTYVVVYLLAPPDLVLPGLICEQEDVLSSSDGRNLVVLLPGSPPRATVDALIGDLTAGLGVPVSAGLSLPRSPSGIPAAVAEARTTAQLAAAAEQHGGCALDDVLVERALSRDETARRHLSGLLTALSGGPDLLATLEALYRHDLDRRAAAAAMHVHRATLDYRLKKIEEMCGVHPLTTRGVRLLSSALFTSRLDAAPHHSASAHHDTTPRSLRS